MEGEKKWRMKIRFWGVRGSIPTPGPLTAKIGGNTSCVEVRAGENLIILDGGTGMRPLGLSLLDQMPVEGIVLFSHFHWDHIQGFPFFAPFYFPENRFCLYGRRGLKPSLRKALSQQMRPPNFPIRIDQMGARIFIRNLREGEDLLFDGIRIMNMTLNHPNTSTSFRIEHDGASLVYATDTEHPPEGIDNGLVRFAEGADILIYDSQFTTEEYQGNDWTGRPKNNWGHSTPYEGINIARSAGIRRLILFHHDPSHDDETVQRIEEECRLEFPGAQAAYEGLEISI
ncbi:MAG: MBL fold metallo-hydrolase [Candidatus Bathyarchaeia archaeon]